MIFGMLQVLYEQIQDPEELPAVRKILDSMAKRWGNSEQKIFIAGAVLHPNIKLAAFNRSLPMFSYAGLRILFEGLYKRFFDRAPSQTKLVKEIRDYIEGSSDYAELLDSQARIIRDAALEAVSLQSSYMRRICVV